MDNNEQERDTHFLGFAELLLADLKKRDGDAFLAQEKYDVYRQRTLQLIAQRAYDLVEYALSFTGVDQYDPTTGYTSASLQEYISRKIPDLTEWPPTPKEPS